MDEQIKKVKGALRRCLGGVKECPMCEYYEGDRCPDEINRDTLLAIEVLEENNKELREANERLLEQLKTARELGQNGVPPMPCKVGDPLWGVFKRDRVISVEKTECQAVLWDGTEWLMSGNVTDGYSLDRGGLFLSIEEAVKKAEEMRGKRKLEEAEAAHKKELAEEKAAGKKAVEAAAEKARREAEQAAKAQMEKKAKEHEGLLAELEELRKKTAAGAAVAGSKELAEFAVLLKKVQEDARRMREIIAGCEDAAQRDKLEKAMEALRERV